MSDIARRCHRGRKSSSRPHLAGHGHYRRPASSAGRILQVACTRQHCQDGRQFASADCPDSKSLTQLQSAGPFAVKDLMCALLLHSGGHRNQRCHLHWTDKISKMHGGLLFQQRASTCRVLVAALVAFVAYRFTDRLGGRRFDASAIAAYKQCPVGYLAGCCLKLQEPTEREAVALPDDKRIMS